jgi:hypothetical protein
MITVPTERERVVSTPSVAIVAAAAAVVVAS